MAKRVSLSSRIFIFMILLIVLASVLIAAVTIYQYGQQSKDYHRQRLERKESQLISSINYIFKQTLWEINPSNLGNIFEYKIHEIANIHNVNFNIYSLNGDLVKASKSNFDQNMNPKKLSRVILDSLNRNIQKRYVTSQMELGSNYRSSYVIFNDLRAKPLGILNVPYFDDDSLNYGELKAFLIRLGYAYVLMFLVAIAFAYFVSKYITKSLKSIGAKMNKTTLGKTNKKIELGNSSVEVSLLVESYNNMIDQLEESAEKLAASEREQAWKEMAKQVAHEIKNPLTPMRLTVQNFQNKFDVNDPDISKKVDEYSKTLIQQIDTMSSIASAFSNFAKMPMKNTETLNVVEIVELALDIFNNEFIKFIKHDEVIIAEFDRSQLTRVITNLVKNALQAVPEERTPKVVVELGADEKTIFLEIADNGSGILKEHIPKIFEPKFTTKTGGMGLGLPMTKNIIDTYNGSITFETEAGKGTQFYVSFPKKI